MPIKTHQVASLQDEALNLQTDYIISILCTQDGFSFTVYDKERNKFLALDAFNFEHQHIDERFIDNHVYAVLKVLVDKTESIANFCRKKGYLIFSPNQAIRVPLALFSEQDQENYIMLNFGKAKGNVFFEVNNQTETVCVYTMYETMLNKLRQLFPNTEVHPLQNVLISHFHDIAKKINEQQSLFCFATNSYLYVQVFQSNTLIFDNSFYYQNKQDFSYYILNVYDKLSLNPENIPMIFTGEISLHSEVIVFLQKYICHIFPLPVNTAFSYSYLFDNIEMERFYHIFNTVPCVLLEELGKAGE